MTTLGERIRGLRKQRNMTLESCAGGQMSKGMLSLIENNKANPSMDNLRYLAERLGVDISELWDDGSERELQILLDEAERLHLSEHKEDWLAAIERIGPFLPKLTKGYTAGRLLELHARLSHRVMQAGWQASAERASAIYDELNILPRRAAVGIFRAMVLFSGHRYEESLEALLTERAEVQAKSGYLDPLTRIDLDTYEAILRFAVNDTEEAARVMDKAIAYSKEKLVFSQIGQLYRIAAYRAVIDGDEEKLGYYEEKLLQYGAFMEDRQAVLYTKMIRIHRLNSFLKEYGRAMDMLVTLEDVQSDEAFFRGFYNLEKGKALFGTGRYEEALELLRQVTVSKDLHHPFDLSIYYEKDTYAALCAEALGDRELALAFAETAEKNMDPMPELPYKCLVRKTLARLRGG